MLMKLCNKCKKPIVSPAKYCELCQKAVHKVTQELKAKRNTKYNANRDPKYKAFYNSKEWRILKEKKLLDEQYKCEKCEHIATEVHHIIPIQTKEGWIRRLDYENLEAICIKCHNYRHKRFGKYNFNN